MKILGKSLIGAREGMDSGDSFSAWNPATGETLEPAFHSATKADVDRAAQLAANAFPVYSQLRAAEKAALFSGTAARVYKLALP